MPSRAQIEHAIRTHFEAWNSKDRQRWFDNFADDIVLEDPVGGPTKIGREALLKSWENSFKDGHDWRLKPMVMQICADQAALCVRNYGKVDGVPVELDSIEIYTVNDAGKVSYIRTYFNPPEGQALDPYFVQLQPPA